MAIKRNAKKALRTSERKSVFNVRRKNAVTKSVKALRKAIVAGDKKVAQAEMVKVQKALDKAAKENTIKKNTASRKKSRFSKMVKNLA